MTKAVHKLNINLADESGPKYVCVYKYNHFIRLNYIMLVREEVLNK